MHDLECEVNHVKETLANHKARLDEHEERLDKHDARLAHGGLLSSFCSFSWAGAAMAGEIMA